MSINTLKFKTSDMRFGITISGMLIDKILKYCKETEDIETGGILVGYYNKKHDWAIVTDISGPPENSKRTSVSFSRGVKGIQKWLNVIWSVHRHYYLGEWHYHPFARPDASLVDTKQMKEHSENDPLKCPEPIMLIFGGDPNDLWKMKAYIYPKGEKLYIMDRCEPMSSGTC